MKDDILAVKEEISSLIYLFDRKVICPVCQKKINVRAVKSTGVRVLSRDTDFMTHYKDPNPLFYGAWLCVHCGYAALSSRFNNVNNKQIKLIKDSISSKWNSSKSYPLVYDVNVAIELHQLALINTIIKVGIASEKASICYKLAWLFRIKKDLPNENKFISHTLEWFLLAYGNESFPINGLNEPKIEYIIGELYRRLGDNHNSLIWLSRVLCNRKANEKIKDMARTQKDIIRDANDTTI